MIPQGVLQKAEDMDVEDVESQRKALIDDIQKTAQSFEKQTMERSLKPIKDIILEKREKALLALSEDDLHAIDQLVEVLEQRKSRRQDIKLLIEDYKKKCNVSGLDFEKAMHYNELINEEKERLEKVNRGVVEIEDKIDKIKRRT